jgi:hypothetical protein
MLLHIVLSTLGMAPQILPTGHRALDSKPVLAMLHIPKAGGSSLASILVQVMAARGCAVVSGSGYIRHPAAQGNVNSNWNLWPMVSRMVATGGDAAPSFYEGLGRHNSKCAKNGTSGGKGDALQSYVDALGASQETCYAVTASPGHSSAHCWPFAAKEWPHLAPKLAGLVGGHFSIGFCKHVLQAACTFVTVLRHPIDRLISQHNYFVLSAQSANQGSVTSNMTPLMRAQWLNDTEKRTATLQSESPTIEVMLQNTLRDPHAGTAMLRYFDEVTPSGSTPFITPDAIRSRLSRAKDLLDNSRFFAVVGVTDRMEDFQTLISLKYGVRNYVCEPTRTTNAQVTSKAAHRYQDLATELRASLEAHLEPDTHLFHHAELRMQQLVEEAEEAFLLERKRLRAYCHPQGGLR